MTVCPPDVPVPQSRGSATPVLEVDRLRIDLVGTSGWINVVDDVSFSLAGGSTLGVVGESGSGKTVMSLAIMGLLPRRFSRVAAHSVRLGDDELTTASERSLEDTRGARIAMVFQEPMTSLNPAFTIGDQIAETVRRHLRLSRRQSWQHAVVALDRVGIPRAATRARAYPHEFSGGMRQRAAIAMALCCDPEVLIADEPTTALDVTIQAQILDLLIDLRDDSELAMVFISHDLGVVAEISDRALVMYAGQAVETADIAELYGRPRHPYTEALLAATPQIGPRVGPLTWIPGVAPSPDSFPSGCRFHPRCGYAQPECAGSPVALRQLEDGRSTRCLRFADLTLRGSVADE